MSSRNWLFALVLLVATLLVYQPAWNGKPVWDDNSHITSAELRSLHGLGRIWTDPAAAPQYYPLLHTVFWVEYKLWKDWPLPYHLITIFFHLVSALSFLKSCRVLRFLVHCLLPPFLLFTLFRLCWWYCSRSST